MKKPLLMIVAIALLFTGCAFHSGLTTNSNLHTTEVVLSRNNFKVVESVIGTSQATYVFGIGGLSKKAMIAAARTKMLSNANLIGSSKALINETVEIKRSVFLVVVKYQVIVSGYIIEFTE